MGPSRIRQFLRRSLAIALPRRYFHVRGPARSRSVCLTFDDGPHPELTPAYLNLLKEEGVPATFFVLGREAERYPELVARMAAEGHTVGHHSYSHGEPVLTSARSLLEEIEQTSRILRPILGHAPTLFRPPKGQLSAGKLWRLIRAGLTTVLWNVDPKDYACESPDQLRTRVQAPLRGGDVVLFHDVHPHALAVLPELIRRTREQDLHFASLADWVGRRRQRSGP